MTPKSDTSWVLTPASYVIWCGVGLDMMPYAHSRLAALWGCPVFSAKGYRVKPNEGPAPDRPPLLAGRATGSLLYYG